ncbi:hypothetical protein KSP40_PGU020654 [Platanthera guangdongensis]|uniref:Trichome birefringence-like N-terminal domain-containing protein n=1 Tax=Platanthera guangdongensis TaxID=2320717 RepID=A0ABR2MCC6_9ASPA
MAARDVERRRYPSSILSFFTTVLLFIATIFVFSSLRHLVDSDGVSNGFQPPAVRKNIRGDAFCNYTSGNWVRHQHFVTPPYDSSCKEIFKGWNCLSNRKSNARDLLQWRWNPSGCLLPPLDPVHFLGRFRNKSIGFVGDSLNRNMFVSLFCMLRRVAEGEVRKWRPAGADRGFIFVNYNLTVAYHRTNLLARYGSWSANSNGGTLESLGFKSGYRVDVDLPEQTWAEAPLVHDILIFNTGHWWWAPSKFDPVHSPMLFFEKGMPILPLVPPDVGIDITLKHMEINEGDDDVSAAMEGRIAGVLWKGLKGRIEACSGVVMARHTLQVLVKGRKESCSMETGLQGLGLAIPAAELVTEFIVVEMGGYLGNNERGGEF